jgi:hypothetical protein
MPLHVTEVAVLINAGSLQGENWFGPQMDGQWITHNPHLFICVEQSSDGCANHCLEASLNDLIVMLLATHKVINGRHEVTKD